MLMTKERRTEIRTLRGWAISVLQEAGATRECEGARLDAGLRGSARAQGPPARDIVRSSSRCDRGRTWVDR
jgi:hypothetical protein